MDRDKLLKLFNDINDRLINVEQDYIRSVTGVSGSVYEYAVYKEYEQRTEEFLDVLNESKKLYDDRVKKVGEPHYSSEHKTAITQQGVIADKLTF